MSFMTQEDSLTWPSTIPLGWSVDWDPSRPAMTHRNDAMLWAKYGAFLATYIDAMLYLFRCPL
jgi:hypothetical protein